MTSARGVAICLVALLPLGSGSASFQLSADFDASSNPVKKVITLLGEMKAQVEKEAKEDTTAYDKYMCWCETYDKEKTAAIESAEQQIAEKTAFIEEAAATEAQLKTEIATLTADIAEDKEALATAVGVREKEHAAFAEEEADMKETRGLLGEAVSVLGKVQLLQQRNDKAAHHAEKAALLQVKHVVGLLQRYPNFASVMQRDLFDMMGSLQDGSAPSEGFLASKSRAGRGAALEQGQLLPWEKTEEQVGAEANPNDLVGASASAKSYNSRSGKILGVLNEMAAEFTKDLTAAQKTDFEAEVAFQKLKAAKLAEIAAAEAQKAQKEEALADIMNKAEQAKEDVESLKNALSEDEQFLMSLKKNCKIEDEQYAKRVAARAEEITALGEALKILTEDSARDLYGKTMSFLQLDGSNAHSARNANAATQRAKAQDQATEKAMQRIAAVARRHKSWALVSLAVRMKLDAFTKVKEAMDKMMAELQKQQKEEYAKWEFCKKEIDATEDSIKVAENTKEDLADKHTDLSNSLSTLSTEIEELKKEVADMESALKQAGEQRHEENALYQSAVMDQRGVINVLKKALTRLESYYAKKTDSSSLVQERARQEPGAYAPPPPAHGKAFEKSALGGGVLQILAKIVSDAEQSESLLNMAEQKAQESYAAFVRDTTSSIEADRAAIQTKEGQSAAAESEKSLTEEAQLGNEADISKLGDILKAHHLECDYVIKYFDMRQQARSEEMDAITDAKAILSGADFGGK